LPIHRGGIQTRGRSRLVCWRFSNGLVDTPVAFDIHTIENEHWQEPLQGDFQKVTDDVLTPSGFWSESFGNPQFIRVDRL
jgi:hypothetical protein